MLYVRCLQVYGVNIVCAVFYPKYNSINLLYSRALIYRTVFFHNHGEFNTILNMYQFIQRMNKALSYVI